MHQVVDTDDACAANAGVLEQGTFDDLRSDVGAVVDDDLLTPTAEVQVAVLIGSHDVSRVQPAILKELGGCALVLPVADGGRWGADPQAALPALIHLAAAVTAISTVTPGTGLPTEPTRISCDGGLTAARPTSVSP